MEQELLAELVELESDAGREAAVELYARLAATTHHSFRGSFTAVSSRMWAISGSFFKNFRKSTEIHRNTIKYFLKNICVDRSRL